jgi:urease accessory protein
MDPRALQMADSMFPVGAYSRSFGLETLVARGEVTKANFRDYVEAMLENQVGPCDLVFMLNAYDRPGDSPGLSDLFGCHRRVPEFHSGSLQMGRRVLQLGARLSGDPEIADLCGRPVHHPVAFGVTAKALGVGRDDAACAFLYSWAAATVSAAVRLVPLGHDAAQEILYEAAGRFTAIYEEYGQVPAEEAWQFAPRCDLAGVEHEKQYTRLFLS